MTKMKKFKNKKEYFRARKTYFLIKRLEKMRKEIDKLRNIDYRCACNVNMIQDRIDCIIEDIKKRDKILGDLK